MIAIPSVQPRNNNFDNLIAYTASNVNTLVDCSKERLYYQQKLLPTLPIFVKHVFYHCKLTPTILVVALIYLERLKTHLPSKSKGEFDTPYKMFIASVILATKFIEDTNTIAHSIYRLVSPLYRAKEINEMERSFLGVIEYDLFVDLTQVSKFIQDHKDIIETELAKKFSETFSV
ncbi:hypothetical protein MFLAVUS_006323 [Mucor flavus]|uniref:Cyclin N-terminal domain-containing protein n=1 Tax=Mucor flavus TaxID=439312 RepID=A0ABP9Z183_9FUNG